MFSGQSSFNLKDNFYLVLGDLTFDMPRLVQLFNGFDPKAEIGTGGPLKKIKNIYLFYLKHVCTFTKYQKKYQSDLKLQNS